MSAIAVVIRVVDGVLVHASTACARVEDGTIWMSDDIPDDTAAAIAGRLMEPSGSMEGGWSWQYLKLQYRIASLLVNPCELTEAEVEKARLKAIAAINARADQLRAHVRDTLQVPLVEQRHNPDLDAMFL